MTDWTRDGLLHLGVGIEDTFVPQVSPGRRALDEYVLTEHDERWEDDLRLAAECGAELIRWGIPWYRVEPEPGRFDWGWTDRVIDRIEELRLTCVVDLVHYGTPLWLNFLDPGYPEAVAAYARAVAERYAGRLRCFTPLNEPILHAYNSGQLGMWPPELTGHDGFVRVLLAICRGMVRTQEELRAAIPDACIVHVDAGLLWTGETSPEPRALLEERRFAALELALGRVGDGHPLTAYLTEHGATASDLAWFRGHASAPDVYGVNYYPAISRVTRVDGAETPIEAGVDGLRELLTAYRERYPGPFALTETSREADGAEKARWLVESLAALEELRADGMSLAAYVWFPFLGIFDWAYRDGTGPRDPWWMPMGLVDLVPDAGGGLARVPNEAFDAFRRAGRALGK